MGRGSSKIGGGSSSGSKAPTNQGEIFGGEYGYFTEKGIEELEELGAERWTKYGKDRLYLRGLAKTVGGLDYSTYKSGNIDSATLDGEKISNSAAGRVLRNVSDAYIDLKSGGIVINDEPSSASEFTVVRKRILDTVKGRRYKSK